MAFFHASNVQNPFLPLSPHTCCSLYKNSMFCVTSLFHPSGLSPSILSSVRPWQTVPSKLGPLPLLPTLARCFLIIHTCNHLSVYFDLSCWNIRITGPAASTMQSTSECSVKIHLSEWREEQKIGFGLVKMYKGVLGRVGLQVYGEGGSGGSQETGLTCEAVLNTPSPSAALSQPVQPQAPTLPSTCGPRPRLQESQA